MADLIFDKNKKKLMWPMKGMTWNAKSGGFPPGPLPSGLYKIARRELTAYTNKIKPSFQDKTGWGFFVPIYPKFETNRGKKNGRLGIHPDGGKPGTLGCIGIINANTKSFYDAISLTSPSTKLTLKVN